jgi:catechol 2,3-dioxygenase-like lactoylglutathione lyase family enzyme
MATMGFDHVGLNVEDLEAARGFFAALGFTCDGPWPLEGEWLDRLIGIPGAHADMVTAVPPSGDGVIEILAFPASTRPEAGPGVDAHGLRHIAFRVEDAQAFVELARQAGFEAVGAIVETGGALRVYVRGPEGVFVEAVQPLT